jgi:uncharacterized OB-fold protein
MRPQATPDTAFFWGAAREGRLVIQRCSACLALRHPPGPLCPHCHSLEWEAFPVSGTGRLFSYTVVHHPRMPGFTGPAIVGIVELDEGVRLVTNLAVDDPGSLSIGEPLEVFFLGQEGGWSVPQFRRPAAERHEPQAEHHEWKHDNE